MADRVCSAEFPSLGIVRNNIAIASTSAFNCSDVSESLAQGTYSCNADGEGTSGSTITAGRKLSAGAKAGIAIAVVAFVVLLAAVAFLLWRRRQQQLQASKNSEQYGDAKEAPDGRELGYVSSDKKDGHEMEYYTVHPQESQKELIAKNQMGEMGRSLSSAKPGPEGRHEMHNTKDPPAAHELEGHQVYKTSWN